MIEQLSLLNEVTITSFNDSGNYNNVFKINVPSMISSNERRSYLNELLDYSFPNSSLTFISLDLKVLGYPYMKKPSKQLTK